MNRTPMLVVLISLGFAGCTDNRERNSADVTIDTIGGTVVVTNQGTTPSAVVPSERVASIGVAEGPPEYTFGAVSSIAVDAAGRIYVSDVMADEVRVYSPAGEFLERIGRRGNGPGEFRVPTGLAFDSSGNLLVRDDTQVQKFAPSAPGGITSQYTGSFQGPPYAFSLMSTRIGTNGRVYYPLRSGRIPDQRHFYLVFDDSGRAIDTLPLPASVRVPTETAIFRTGASGGRMVPGLARAPFAPEPSWDVTPGGTLLIAEGSEYEIVELNRAGDTLRLIRKLAQTRSVPTGEYEDSLRSVRQRVAEAPAPLERLEGVSEEIRRGQLSRTLPQVVSLHVGTDGRIWVRRWPDQEQGGSVYDVFSGEGVFERTVMIADRFAALPESVFTPERVYGVVVDPETEVQRVVVHEIPQ